MAHKMLNGISVELTAAELSAHQEAQRLAHLDAEAGRAAKAAAIAKEASGKQKLKDLGLDDEEIKALIGI